MRFILSKFGISSTAVVATLVTIINNSRGNIDDFSILQSNLQSQKKQKVNEDQKIKNMFKNLVKYKYLTLYLYFIFSLKDNGTTGLGGQKFEIGCYH